MARRWTLALVVAAPVDAALTLALPAALAGAADAVLAHPERPAAATPAVLLLAAVLLAGAVAATVLALAGPACSAAATVAQRERFLDHVLALGPQRVGWAAGDLTARLVTAAADAGNRVPAAVGTGTALLTSLGAILGLGVLSPWLALAFLGGVVPGVLLVRLFGQAAGDGFVRYQQAQSAIAARLSGALTGLRSIHAAGAEAGEAARVLAPLPELAATGREFWATQRRTVWQAMLLIAAVELAVLATAGTLVARHALPAGALAAAAGWSALGIGFFEQVEALAGLAHARAGRQRLAEVLDAPAPTPGTAELPPDGPGELRLHRVVVAGESGGAPLLGPLDLTVPGGSTVALVGRSGAGKSLLAAVAGGLRAPDRGIVTLDGVPLDRLSPTARRAAVGYAFERPVLVGRTLGEALEGAGPEQLRAARAAEFVARLPAGPATPPGELRLSGGELQRLGLARLLARPTRVAVLDDATGSLDLVTEFQVTRALTAATAGRTRLVVAHRAAAAARADLVAWLDGGRLRALAPHAELLADPEYRAVLVATAVS
ncbi:ATP-binding cassette domain-containing protein [Kitasatospora sp. LaBMicrA B282]|uniref:ATP-binding cassette domain-containing protein n=1 Tax=Kitasatospora sp. LaBMicrA B282 TaxID=3420949 RepID=UPI003D095F1C